MLSGDFKTGDIILVTADLEAEESEEEIILEKGDPNIYGDSFLPDEEDEPVAVG